MKTKIYGASDDLIEVEGGLRDEFDAVRDGTHRLDFSDGTALSVEYTDAGLWRIERIARGLCLLSIERATDPDSDRYSDVATLDGEVQWVRHTKPGPR